MLLLNNQRVKYFIFSGGEIQVKLPEPTERGTAFLTWKPNQTSDIMLLLLTVNALRHQGINDIQLEILYLPYARQDRVCAAGEAFSLEVIIQLIDSIKFSAIELHDVHNYEKTKALFKNNTRLVNLTPMHQFHDNPRLDHLLHGGMLLCAPDEGALSRIAEFEAHYDCPKPISLTKIRNPDTGKITGMTLNPHDHDLSKFDVLIIDDICDGGQTFIDAAYLLREKGVKNLYLYVTHGIFSKGLENLLNYFEHVYCHHVRHDSLYQSDEYLTILQEFHSVL